MEFPPVFTNVWDTTFPPDTQLANLLGQDLRNFRTDVMQRMSLLSGTLANIPTPEIVNASWGGVGYGLLFFATDTGQIFQWSGAAWGDITSSFIKNSVLFKDGAIHNHTGTTTEDTIYTTTILANTLGTTGVLRGSLGFAALAQGAGVTTVRVRFGGTAFAVFNLASSNVSGYKLGFFMSMNTNNTSESSVSSLGIQFSAQYF